MLDASRDEFAARGYDGASLDEIASRAGLTKGALYHHFASKAALLEAVYIELEEEAATRVRAAVEASTGDALVRIAIAIDAFFEASADPTYQRVVLREARGVIDRSRGRRLDHAVGLGLVIELIEAMQREGVVGPLPVTMTARIFLAALCEIAMSAADSDAPLTVRREGMVVLASMIEGIRRASAQPSTPRPAAGAVADHAPG